jgi:hypothetical protein
MVKMSPYLHQNRPIQCLSLIRALFYESLACFMPSQSSGADTIEGFPLSMDIDCSKKVSNYIYLKVDFSMHYLPI